MIEKPFKYHAHDLLLGISARLKEWQDTGAAAPSGAGGATTARGMLDDAENALIALGYKPQEASRALALVADDEPQSSEELIRLALRSMLPAEVKNR